MKVTARFFGSVVVLDVGRRFSVGEGLADLDKLVESQLRRGRRHFVLDLERTRRFDAAGVGALVRLFCRLQSEGGGLHLLHLPRQLRDLLELAQLLSFFRVFSSEREAVWTLRASSLRRRSAQPARHRDVPVWATVAPTDA